MAHMIINGRQVELDGEKSVLSVIRKAGIDLPTLCYDPDLSPYGGCRMCIVENERGSMVAACSEVPYDGLSVKTNTKKLMKHRKLMLELLLGSHCRDCLTCKRSEKCQLQELAVRYGVDAIRFQYDKGPRVIEETGHIIEIDRIKCVLCGSCIRTCAERQNVGALDFVERGSHMYVSTAFDKPLGETNCTGCGQCSVSCPTGAITVKDETDKLWRAINDDACKTVALVGPSIVATAGAELGLPAGADPAGRLVGALRRIGFDEVYCLDRAAEDARAAEISAFLERFDGQGTLPWFTSWCPAWRQYVNDRHPDLQEYLSANASPVRAMSAAVKAAKAGGADAAAESCCADAQAGASDTGASAKSGGADAAGGLFTTVIGPCTALKHEHAMGRGGKDVGLVLTARELVQIIRETGLAPDRLAPETPDALAGGEGGASGAAGNASAPIGNASAPVGNALAAAGNACCAGETGVGAVCDKSLAEAVADAAGDRGVRALTVYGLANAEEIVRQIKAGDVRYDFIEVLACPRGCATGAGHPLASVKQRMQSET